MRILFLSVLSVLAFSMFATVAIRAPHMMAQQKVVQSTDGFVTTPDATRMNARFDIYDRNLASPCASAIAAKMEKHAPAPEGARYDITPNLHLRQPRISSLNWAPQVNYDFDVIDAVITHCSTTK